MPAAEKIKIRVPMIVTADGKWAVNGSHSMEEPDWGWLDEMCDFENETESPQRYWVEIIVDKPVIQTVTATTVTPAEAT